jgi:hypothetical protein
MRGSRRLCGSRFVACAVGGFAATFFASAAVSRATVIWNETSNGDLSNNQAAPNAFTLSLGTNSVIGSVGTPDNQDWIALTVPAGDVLSSLILKSYTSTDAQGFTGMQSGPSFVGSIFTQANYLGYAHFGTGAQNGSLPATNLVNADLLPIMADNSPTGTSPGAQGFTPPLPAGTYTFLIQQTGSANTAYQFDYNVSAVPEPGAVCFVSAMGIAISSTVRRGRKSGSPAARCRKPRR